MKRFYLLTILCALLGISQAWAETCIVYEHEAEESVKTNSGNTAIFTTPDLGNTDGIDTIRFEYKMSSSIAKKMKVRYSTDGTNFVDFDGGSKSCSDKWRGKTGDDNTDIYVIVPEALRTSIKKVQFAVFEGSIGRYTYSVRKIQITQAPTLKLDKSSDAFPMIAVGSNTSKTYTVSTWNVKSAINVAISGDNASLFSYELSEPTGSCPTERTLTITYSPDEASESHSALVTVSTDDASSATLSLTASADAEVDPVYTCNIADKYYVEDDAIDLAALWTSTSKGDITYSFTFEAASGDQEGATAPALNENLLSLGKAGTLTLKLTQAEKGAYRAAEDTKTVTIARRTPVITWYAGAVYYNSTIENFWSSNSDTKVTVVSSDEDVLTIADKTVTTYNKETSVYVTLTQAGNYKWNALEENHDVVLAYPAIHLPIASLTSANASTYELSFTSEAKWETKDGVDGITFGDGTWAGDRPEGYAIFHFTGIPDAVNFTTSCVAWGFNYPEAKDYVFEVFESVDGVEWTKQWACDNTKKYTESDNQNADRSIALSPSARYIKLRYKGSCWGRMTNISVTEKKQFAAEDVNFGDVVVKSGDSAKTLTFKHANAGYKVSVVFDDENEPNFFSIDHLDVANTGGDKYGEENFQITLNPYATGEHTATVTFSDELGNEKVVTLRANVIDTTTAVDNTASEVKATKILRNGQVLILRDGKVYNLNGQEVR